MCILNLFMCILTEYRLPFMFSLSILSLFLTLLCVLLSHKHLRTTHTDMCIFTCALVAFCMSSYTGSILTCINFSEKHQLYHNSSIDQHNTAQLLALSVGRVQHVLVASNDTTSKFSTKCSINISN